MSHLTLRYRNASGDLLHESDVTLHEFIPIVRHVTRSLASEPEIVADPTAYRALIRPGYGTPAEEASLPAPTFRLSTDGGVLKISEEDLDSVTPVSYADEVKAFYARGTSALCETCPERLRCPGSGQPAAELGGWIEFDPDTVVTDDPVSHFALRIESTSGRVLQTSVVRLAKFETLLIDSYRRFKAEGRLSRSGGSVRIEVIARKDGQRVERTVPVAATPPPAAASSDGTPAPAGPAKTLVDWDRIEASEPPAPPAREIAGAAPAASTPAPESDLEIRIFPTQSEPLPERRPPAAEPLRGTTMVPGQLPIYIHRSAYAALNAQLGAVRNEAGGILVGEAVVDPDVGKPYVEIVAAIPAGTKDGSYAKVQMNSAFLREIQERIDRDYPGRRTIGWYQFHIQYVTLQTKADNTVTAGLWEPFRLFEDETFMHRNFFPQRWHVALIIDATRGGLRFYHLNDGTMDVTTSYQLFG